MVNERANIVIASRFVTKARGNSPREGDSKLISWLIQKQAGQTITDPTSGMRMYDRGLIETYARSFVSPRARHYLAADASRKVVRLKLKCVGVKRGPRSFYNSIMYMAARASRFAFFQWFMNWRHDFSSQNSAAY